MRGVAQHGTEADLFPLLLLDRINISHSRISPSILKSKDTKFIKFKYVGAFETIESKILCIEYGHGQLSWLYIFMVPLADFYCNIFYVKMFYKRSSEITL